MAAAGPDGIPPVGAEPAAVAGISIQLHKLGDEGTEWRSPEWGAGKEGEISVLESPEEEDAEQKGLSTGNKLQTVRETAPRQGRTAQPSLSALI